MQREGDRGKGGGIRRERKGGGYRGKGGEGWGGERERR